MQTGAKSGGTEGGSTLLVSLFVTLIVAAALTVYLQLATNQNQLTYRSQTWNSAMTLVEAGLEEGLQHCNYNSSNLTSQGWALSGGRYTKSNSVGLGYYVTSISTSAPYSLLSTGFYPMPNGSKYVSRVVQVTTTNSPGFTGAMVSKSSVSMNGNGIFIDSYDSRDATKSTNGKYITGKRRDKADMLLTSSGTSFDTGNGNVWGKAYTGPSVTATTGPNGAIGDAAWNGSSSGIKPGWWINTANFSVPDVVAPFTVAVPPASGTVWGVAYDYVLSSGDYAMETLDKKCVVTGVGVRLYVSGNISSSTLCIQTNASVKIYCAGTSASFNTINNYTNATALQFFALPSVTSIDLGGNWEGGCYAPSAAFSIAGNTTISGAIVAASITMKGTSAFHYDEALNSTNQPGGFVIISWNEL